MAGRKKSPAKVSAQDAAASKAEKAEAEKAEAEKAEAEKTETEKAAGITEYRVVEPIRHDGTRLEPGETLPLPDDNNTRALLAGGAIQAASE